MDSTDFPDDLLQIQHAWNATYEALAAPRPRDTTALRHRLLRLSVHLWWHPYFKSVPSVPAARAELRQLARIDPDKFAELDRDTPVPAGP